MISAAQATLLRGLIGSAGFRDLLTEIAEELFEEWTQTTDLEAREHIFYQFHAMTLLADVIEAKIHDITSGDTNV